MIDPDISIRYEHYGFTREQVASQCQFAAQKCWEISKSTYGFVDRKYYAKRAEYFYRQARLIMGIEK